MKVETTLRHGTVTASRRLSAPRQLVYEAWTELEHRRHWFVGPGQTEIARSVDLRVGGGEVAHGRFDSGIESIYTSRYHLIEPNERLIYAFDMLVDGEHFSVSLAGVEFRDADGGTELIYTEQAFFFVGDYDADGRAQGTEELLEKFAAHVGGLTAA